MSYAKARITFSREEIVTMLYALEAVIDEYRYDGGLILAEREMALRERLDALHKKRDTRHMRPEGTE